MPAPPPRVPQHGLLEEAPDQYTLIVTVRYGNKISYEIDQPAGETVGVTRGSVTECGYGLSFCNTVTRSVP
ncbi:hypothetical protein [Natrinema halophilum]|uniref:Uncharacterized protein n=1 Tax=Natrinema halophilum TaxID=1699371 RepID=A0A7D5GT99_9EURY|nr:hypothetical protein [Natrinema halophilum]QLG49949.1 hypothetical protein HYG82_14355 [Natrinema halophilum]